VVGVEQWAMVRRMHRVEGLSGREITRRTGLARDTVARLVAASEPPTYSRAEDRRALRRGPRPRPARAHRRVLPGPASWLTTQAITDYLHLLKRTATELSDSMAIEATG
jgi:transposase